MDILFVTLIFLLDIAVIYNIVHLKHTRKSKVLYSLIVLFLPIIGVTIYYLIRKDGNKKVLGILLLFLSIFSFISCNNDNNEQRDELIPKVLYQTSWRGTRHCEVWTVQNIGVGIQFINTQKGKVNWESYNEVDITYSIKGKYITFNNNTSYLGETPWVIKSYTDGYFSTYVKRSQWRMMPNIVLDFFWSSTRK